MDTIKVTMAFILMIFKASTAQVAVPHYYAAAELDSFAVKVARIYDLNIQLDRGHRDLSTNSFRKKGDADRAWLSLAPINNQIVIARNAAYNPWDSIFRIIKCIPLNVFHGPEYVMAAGYDGTLYYLRGFDTNDFKNLLHYKIGIVSSDEKALNVAKLFVSTVQYEVEWADFVDSSNISRYASSFPYLTTPVIIRSNVTYTVRLFTIEPESNHIILHNVILSESNFIKPWTHLDYQSIVMNDGEQ